MSAAARSEEAERAATAYQTALSVIGTETVAEALALWSEVPPGSTVAQKARWMNAVVQLVKRRRSQSRRLARSYYRLSRALVTGRTIKDPERSETRSVKLGELRTQFDELTGSLTPATGRSGSVPASGPISSPAPSEGRENGPSHDDDLDDILLDEIAKLNALEARSEALAEQEVRTALAALGPANQDKLLKLIDEELPAGEAEKLKAQAHRDAGARQAAAAARIGMNGGRSESWLLQENDKLAIGWVRISTTGHPCGWCAMLISRGAVYRSERSASFDYNDGDTYHDNCHCIAVPVFSREQYRDSPIFRQNREYGELWPIVTQGLGGKDALSAWRHYMRKRKATAA